MSYKEEIVKLRKQDKTYDEIEEELGCSKGTISYHCKQEGLEDIGKKQHKLPDKKIEQIRKLRKQGHSYSEIEEKADVSHTAAAKYGRKVSEQKENETQAKPKQTRKEFLETNKYLGRVTAEKVAAKFTELGHTVLDPRGEKRYDFVVDAFGEFYRIQCKHGNTKQDAVEFRCRWQTKMPSETRTYTYSSEDIDFFAVYASEKEQVYIVPVAETPSTVCKLRTTETKNGQTKRVNWAEDYEIENSLFDTPS